MGYTAYTVDSDFTVPADKIDAALHAINVVLVGSEDDVNDGAVGAVSLTEAFAENTGFEDPDTTAAGDWILGHHRDKYFDSPLEEMIAALAPFATEGSYVRFQGEDDALWGFRVINGRIEAETGDYTWKVVPRKDGSTPAESVMEEDDVTYINDEEREFTFTDAGGDMMTVWLNDGVIHARNESVSASEITSVTIDLSKSAAFTLGQALTEWSHQAD